jgi:hypothetical protein
MLMNAPSIEEPPFYESSNGDDWCLTSDPSTGELVVMHRPNIKSGGQASYIDVCRFLQESPDGPQPPGTSETIGALRPLLRTRGSMKLILCFLCGPFPRASALIGQQEGTAGSEFCSRTSSRWRLKTPLVKDGNQGEVE